MQDFEAKKLFGFRHLRSESVPDVCGTLHRFIYEKTDTPLYFLEREDKNKTFAIGFHTPPSSDNGVFHVLEHTVLSGSEKYPLKDPLTELLKGSLSTYLNALTYPERTVYPVSSMNPRAFLDLIDVYMDAVLHPLVLHDASIFLQEGRRYEPTEDGIEANGVVYNEMLGAYASHEELGEHLLYSRLFPGGTYGYDSGGEPSSVLSLTHGELCRAHAKYYHPSNAFIFLDGEVDLISVLSLLDGYLSPYGRSECHSTLTLGAPTLTEPHYARYPEAEDKTESHVSIGWRTEGTNELDGLALELLCEALADSNGSPLKAKILNSGLCENMYCYFSSARRYPTMQLRFTDVTPGCEEQLLDLYTESLKQIISEGVSRTALEGALNSAHFRTAEADYGSYPLGMIYMGVVFEELSKGNDPAAGLCYEDSFAKLRGALDTDYYEVLAEKHMLPSSPATVILQPDPTLESRQQEELRRELKARFAGMSEEDRHRLILEDEALRRRLSTPDSAEALAALPTLSLSDIDPVGEEPVMEPCEILTRPALLVPIDTRGITYATLYLDLSDTEEDEISALSLLCMIYRELDVGDMTGESFSNLVKSELGSLSVSISAAANGGKVSLRLAFRFCCLDSKREVALELLRKYLYDADLSAADIIAKKLTQLDATLDTTLSEQGNRFAIMRSAARYDQLSAVKERLSGFDFMMRMREAAKDAEEYGRRAARIYCNLRRRCFHRGRAGVAIGGKAAQEYAEQLLGILTDGAPFEGKCSLPLFPRRSEGIVISSPVAYTALMSNLALATDAPYRGSFGVLSSLTGYEILWNEIRIKGGAYDTGMLVRGNSLGFGYYSYRDPSPAKTLATFRNTPALISSFLGTAPDLTKYIIGTVGAIDTVCTPRSRIDSAIACYHSGRSAADLRRIRRQIIDTDVRELTELCEVLQRAGERGTATVLADRDTLGRISELGEILKL